MPHSTSCCAASNCPSTLHNTASLGFMTSRREEFAGAVFPAESEERLKADFFRDTAPVFFVDGGATAPQAGSQSGALDARGWSGVLVEPQPDLAEQLRRERRAKVYAVACSKPENAGKALTLYLAGIRSEEH